MRNRRQTAFHEAAHAVAAFHSKFHFQSGRIRVSEDGGGVRITINKKKVAKYLEAQDRPIDLPREIAVDCAIIACAGLAGVEIANERDADIEFDRIGIGHDCERARRALLAVDLPIDLKVPRDRARTMLEREWWAVKKVATFLLSEDRADAQVVYEMIEILMWEGEPA